MEEWLEAASCVAMQTLRGDRIPVIDGKEYIPMWWTGVHPEIRIFWEPDITQSTVDLVVLAMHETMQRIGYDILPEPNFVLLGSEESAMQQIRDACVSDVNTSRVVPILDLCKA